MNSPVSFPYPLPLTPYPLSLTPQKIKNEETITVDAPTARSRGVFALVFYK
jgi:hypothetical protein